MQLNQFQVLVFFKHSPILHAILHMCYSGLADGLLQYFVHFSLNAACTHLHLDSTSHLTKEFHR